MYKLMKIIKIILIILIEWNDFYEIKYIISNYRINYRNSNQSDLFVLQFSIFLYLITV